MDTNLRTAQLKVLKAFSKAAKDFALTGGTALELYYLKHRFSADLDFFSPKYSQKEIGAIVSGLKSAFGAGAIKLETEFRAANKAEVKFFTVKTRGIARPLKLDFVEDVLFANPKIRKFSGVRVYDVKNIYLQKITAITGVKPESDEIGRQFMEGRREARDIFDLYMLSQNIEPLHIFLKNVSGQIRRGMVHWYRTFSRQDLKFALLDLDIYDKKFDARRMIIYLENEIKRLIEEALE